MPTDSKQTQNSFVYKKKSRLFSLNAIIKNFFKNRLKTNCSWTVVTWNLYGLCHLQDVPDKQPSKGGEDRVHSPQHGRGLIGGIHRSCLHFILKTTPNVFLNPPFLFFCCCKLSWRLTSKLALTKSHVCSSLAGTIRVRHIVSGTLETRTSYVGNEEVSTDSDGTFYI